MKQYSKVIGCKVKIKKSIGFKDKVEGIFLELEQKTEMENRKGKEKPK